MDDLRIRGRGNPLNRGTGRGRGRGQQYNNVNINRKPGPELSALSKFQEAQARFQASVQKHIKQEYDSSSEEEELESDSILGK